VERAANIRIQHPNLSTEDAMKLAGYTEDEAKDPKRQSNVRQKTHRLTKGRKRHPSSEFLPDQERKRLPIADTHGRPSLSHDQGPPGDYLPLPIDYDPMPAHPFEKVNNITDPHAHFHTPMHHSPDPDRRLPSELHRTPGSARGEKAARFWLDNPNLSIANAMKLAGFSEEEVKDTYRQNDIRQTAHQMTVQIAAKTNKGPNNMSSELRGRLTAIDQKIDEMANRLERTVDIKLQELGARIDDKFNHVHQQLHMMGGNPVPNPSTGTTNYGYHQGGSQQQQQQQQQQQHTYQNEGSYPHAQQQSQGYNIPTGHAQMQGGSSYPHRSSLHSQSRHDSVARGQDGNQHHIDSTVAL